MQEHPQLTFQITPWRPCLPAIALAVLLGFTAIAVALLVIGLAV